jgi:hypothetical protein
MKGISFISASTPLLMDGTLLAVAVTINNNVAKIKIIILKLLFILD